MSNKIYTTVPVPKFPRNIFSLSRPVVGSMRMQRLYPSEIMEILPGDAMNVRQETFVRTAPLVAPPLARVNVQHHAFFVPGWQLHRDFDDFITGGEKMDFSDHLPYVWLKDIYQQIDGHLGLMVTMFNDETDWGSAPDYVKNSSIMEQIIAVIEGCDYSRACPFGMPEFQPLEVIRSDGSVLKYDDITADDFDGDTGLPTADLQKMVDVLQANWDAWREYNPATLATKELRVNLLPFMAQLKIWCEFFRDENLCEDYWEDIKDPAYDVFDQPDYFFAFNQFMSQIWAEEGIDPPDSSLFDGTEWRMCYILLSVKNRAWRKDRFTAALPWTQKGPDITIPIAGEIPVSVTSSEIKPTSNVGIVSQANTGNIILNTTGFPSTSLSGTADLSKAAGMATMRDLRRAEAVEEFEEADGRFGNRYPENTLGQFGVYTPDSRLPRCQFLGSTSQTVGFGEIAQTSETGDTPLGTLAGKGTSYNPSFLFKQRFTMHGFVVVFTSITVQAMYEQGIHPMFSRFDRTEYGWPRYARLGEEPLYTKEICAVTDGVAEDTVFGYAPRYSTYKSDTGSIHGQMKTTLNYWTFSRKFEKSPVLNEEFIYHEPRRDAFALSNPYAEQFYFEIDWKVRSSRLLPFFGVASI